MELFYIILFFVIGINFGSFYNVVGYRLPKGESIISPPSHCPNCKYQLKVTQLIPIFSYLFQKGKCVNCGRKIPIFYLLFELATGILFVVAYIIFGISINLFIALILISMSLIIFISDYFYYIISDEVLIVSALLIAICIFLKDGFGELGLSLLNAIIAFGIMYLIKLLGDFLFKKESMGGGDIKLMFIFGLVFGFEISLFIIFLASLIGLPISFFLLYFNKNNERIIPFGPFLCFAALIMLFFQIDINNIMIFVTTFY